MGGRVLVVVALVGGLLAAAAQPVAAQGTVLCAGLVATIVGTPGPDNLEGTEGPDIIAGLQGNDVIDGLGGDDIICGGRGSDLLIGGLGFDVIYGAQDPDVIFASGAQSLYPPFAMEDTKGARIFAGAGNDIVYGSNRWDRMQGGPGNDTLFGFAGRDWMRGGPGSDRVVGHGGADDLHGGSGLDWVAADNGDAAVRGGPGADVCPDLSAQSMWRGCASFFATEADPTLPRLTAFPEELRGGPADTYVYRGLDDNGDTVFIGVALDLDLEAAVSEFSVWEVSVIPLEFGQATAIEEALIQRNPQVVNEFHALDPSEPYYDAALAWADNWLILNDF